MNDSLITHWSNRWPLERVLFAMAGTVDSPVGRARGRWSRRGSWC